MILFILPVKTENENIIPKQKPSTFPLQYSKESTWIADGILNFPQRDSKVYSVLTGKFAFSSLVIPTTISESNDYFYQIITQEHDMVN